MADSKLVSKVIIKRGDKILLLQRQDNGEWELPGGHVETGESFRNGAIREVSEETGIKIKKLKAIKGDKEFRLYVTKPKVVGITLSHEHTDYIWVSSKSIKRVKLSGPTVHNLKFILKAI